MAFQKIRRILAVSLVLILTRKITTATEITCNHGFEQKYGSSWFSSSRNYVHFVDDSRIPDESISNTCKSKTACVSVVRYNKIELGCTDRATKIYHTCAENFSKLKVPVENGEKYPCTDGKPKKWDGKFAYDEVLPVDKACMEKRYCQNNSITLPYCIPLTNDYPTWACDMFEGFGNSKDIAHNCKDDEKIPKNSTESDFVMKKNYYWMGTENTRYPKKNAQYHELDRFVHANNSLLESLPGEFHQPNILVCDTDKCNSDKFVACSFKSTSNHYNLSSYRELESEVQDQRIADLNANHVMVSFQTCSNNPTPGLPKAYFANVTEFLAPEFAECAGLRWSKRVQGVFVKMLRKLPKVT